MSARHRKERIPDQSAWAGYETDLDVQYMHRIFFGKTHLEVERHFGGIRSIQRMDELLFAPRKVFQYYVRAFASYVMSEQAIGDSDSASPFLSLLEEREKRDPGSVKAIYPTLSECVDFVANNQGRFDASPDIYGDFKERARHIRELCDD